MVVAHKHICLFLADINLIVVQINIEEPVLLKSAHIVNTTIDNGVGFACHPVVDLINIIALHVGDVFDLYHFFDCHTCLWVVDSDRQFSKLFARDQTQKSAVAFDLG